MSSDHDSSSSKTKRSNNKGLSKAIHNIISIKDSKEYRQEVIYWAVGPFLGIIITGVSTWFKIDPVLNAVFTFSGLFVGFSITTLFTLEKHVNKISSAIKEEMLEINLSVSKIHQRIDAEINKINIKQSHLFEIHPISIKDADKRMHLSCEKSQIVKNTYVNLHTISGSKTADGISTVKMYEKFLSRSSDNRWVDITSVEDFLDGRFQRISMDSNNSTGKHTIHLLSEAIPIINYVIFGSDENDLEEVYFGWVSNPQSRIEVYYSSNKRILSIFNSHFQILENINHSKKIEVDYAKRGSERFKHINTFRYSGYWISMSGSMNFTRINDVRDASIIHIYYADGRWQLLGYIFKLSDYVVYERLYADKCAIVDRSINYKFEKIHIRNDSRKSGVGMYMLSRAPIDAATGFYVDNDSSKKMRTLARRIYNDNDNKVIEAFFERIYHNDAYEDIIPDVQRVVSDAISRMIRENLARKNEKDISSSLKPRNSNPSAI